MMFILILLIIILIGGSGAFFLKSFDEKYVALQKNNLLLKSQISKIQEKYDLLDSSTKKCKLEFLNVDNNYGLLPKETIIRVSPLNNSCILKKIDIGMQVGILEKVKSNDSIWYYVVLPLENNINSRGWVEEFSFSEIYHSKTEISEK